MSHWHRLLLMAAVLVPFNSSTDAATFTVDSTVDGVDASPGNGVCLTPIGTCTLRAAIQESNALAGADLIVVPAGTYLLARPGAWEDECSTGDLDVLESVTIRGEGSDRSIVDGNNLDRVFDLVPPFGATIRFEGLTIQHGLLPSSSNIGDAGGGVRVNGPVWATFEHCRLHGNRAPSTSTHSGYAIYAFFLNSLALYGSEVDENRRTDGAAAAGMTLGFTYASAAAYRLERSWVHNNDGDGVWTQTDTSTIIDRSTIEVQGGSGVSAMGSLFLLSSTLAWNQEGGLFAGSSEFVHAVNSTISSNRTNQSGGGIWATDGIVYLSSVTITGNLADADHNGSGNGGGLFVSPGADVRLRHVLLGGNSDLSPVGEVHPDCSGVVFSERFNLISVATGCTISGDTGGNIGGVLPGLGALAWQGGITPVHVPLPGSPVVDAGDEDCTDLNGNLLRLDQRGYPRAVDGDDLPGAYCDLGAVERYPGMLFMDDFETGLSWAWSATFGD